MFIEAENVKEIKGADIDIIIGKYNYYFTFYYNKTSKKIFLYVEAEDEAGNKFEKITHEYGGEIHHCFYLCYTQLKITSKNTKFRETMDKFREQEKELAREEWEEWVYPIS